MTSKLPRPRSGRSPPARPGRRPAPCCAPWGSARRTWNARRWRWPRPGTRSPRATAPEHAGRAAAKEGVRQAGAVPIEFGTIAVSDGIAMGHGGHEGVAGQPRGDRRLGGAGHARRAVRRAGRHRGLRQVAAGHADGVRAAGRARRVPVRRDHPAGLGGGQGGDHPGRVRGGRRVMPRGRCRTANCTTSSAPRARARSLRGHVHREHDGGGRRGARHVAARARPAPAVSAERTELARRTGEIGGPRHWRPACARARS